ncbi:MAG: hypothetical protein GXO66_02260 [Euryarchaeota archaeon]|nr:hypothetical protein [Euryarchaeota archaeon]
MLTSLEKIRIWEPSHGLPFVRHEWSPDKERVEVGSTLKVKAVPWTFTARCVEVGEGRVVWEFTGGPLKGTEAWIVRAEDDGSSIIKLLVYEVPRLRDRLLWLLLGRKVHSWASKRQLMCARRLAEGRR